MTLLEPDRGQIEQFFDALFRHSGADGFISFRSFSHDNKPLRIEGVPVKSGFKYLCDVAEDHARRAANEIKPAVFCPPIALFNNKDRAREQDLLAGLVLSVECDERPQEAREKLEAILGPATAVIYSGGKCKAADDTLHDKLHLHWRLAVPALGNDLTKLKRARELATRLVGGDASNIQIVHPLRWPGSWHRKGKPVLCGLAALEPDREIDLDAALDALEAARPKEEHKANGFDYGAGQHDRDDDGDRERRDWAGLVQNILAGKDLHQSTMRLAASYVGSGMKPDHAVRSLQSLMLASSAPHDERWQSRLNDLPRLVRDGVAKYGGNAQPLSYDGSGERQEGVPAPEPLIKSSQEFVAEFIPPDYLVDGLLQEAFLYSLTGATGAGKTAITLRLAASVALGITFANRETKKRRALYLAAENPVDIRMRWIALAQQMDFDADTIKVYFIEGSFKISQMGEHLKQEATALGGEFGLVIIDTGPVFYEGDDENNRTQQARHAGMLRELIDIIPGKPAVIANVHPVKNAAPDNLLPAGGGSFLNQVDGNLTAAKNDNTTELHWQGKFRGVEFAPMHFMLKTVTHERLKDSRGRLMPTVISEWISDGAKEEIAKQRVNDEDRLLALIEADPKATQATLATKMGWTLFSGEPNRMRAGRALKAMKAAKLIKETRTGNYRLTDEGKKALKGEK